MFSLAAAYPGVMYGQAAGRVDPGLKSAVIFMHRFQSYSPASSSNVERLSANGELSNDWVMCSRSPF
jgi:hypothetical protein